MFQHHLKINFSFLYLNKIIKFKINLKLQY